MKTSTSNSEEKGQSSTSHNHHTTITTTASTETTNPLETFSISGNRIESVNVNIGLATMTEVNWRKVCGMTALLMALLLVTASIYLHVRQKHHLGRLRHDSRGSGVVALNEQEWSAEKSSKTDTKDQDHVSKVLKNTLSGSSTSRPNTMEAIRMMPSATGDGAVGSNGTFALLNLTEACLQCICETVTGCVPQECSGNSAIPCGVYRISRPYWYQAGKQRLEGDASVIDSFDEGYAHCVNNVYCASRTIAGYIKRYRVDCNGDGIIDCHDYIALHILGPVWCLNTTLSPIHEHRMELCKKQGLLKK